MIFPTPASPIVLEALRPALLAARQDYIDHCGLSNIDVELSGDAVAKHWRDEIENAVGQFNMLASDAQQKQKRPVVLAIDMSPGVMA